MWPQSLQTLHLTQTKPITILSLFSLLWLTSTISPTTPYLNLTLFLLIDGILSVLLFLYDPYFSRTGSQRYKLAITVSSSRGSAASLHCKPLHLFILIVSVPVDYFCSAVLSILHWYFHIFFEDIIAFQCWGSIKTWRYFSGHTCTCNVYPDRIYSTQSSLRSFTFFQ